MMFKVRICSVFRSHSRFNCRHQRMVCCACR